VEITEHLAFSSQARSSGSGSGRTRTMSGCCLGCSKPNKLSRQACRARVQAGWVLGLVSQPVRGETRPPREHMLENREDSA